MFSGCGRQSIANVPPDRAKAMEIRKALAASAAPAEGETAAAEEAKATGWATIKGRFVYDGTPPAPKALTVDKDTAVCGRERLVDESLVVGSDGGLANVVLFLRNKNVEVHPDYEATAKERVVLDNKDCHFVPHIAAVRTGQPLILKNSDGVGHNTNAALVANPPFNPIIAANGEAQQVLDRGELAPVAVACNIHPWMKGWLLVQSHPYMSVTAPDGAFELKNVPAGIPLEVQVWHEAATTNNKGLGLSHPEVKWQSNGRFTVTLQPDQVLDLAELKVPASALAVQ